MALVLDEPTDMDQIFEFNGFKFIADKNLLQQAQPVKVDFKGVGFQITSNLKMEGGSCGSCGSTCS